jgi:hypothetical protein
MKSRRVIQLVILLAATAGVHGHFAQAQVGSGSNRPAGTPPAGTPPAVVPPTGTLPGAKPEAPLSGTLRTLSWGWLAEP